MTAYLGLIAFSILGTIATNLTDANPGPIRPVASALTILAGVFALFSAARGKRKVAFVSVLALGTAAELVGLYTGLPFGHYRYTSNWLPFVALPAGRLFPLMLPLAWVMVATGAYLAVGKRSPLNRLLATALLATAVDASMEKVMSFALSYWRWDGNSVPWLNGIGWFATSGLAALILAHFEFQSESPALARLVLACYLLLVAVIGIFYLEPWIWAPPFALSFVLFGWLVAARLRETLASEHG